MVNYQSPPQLLIHVSTLVPGMESIAKVIDWTSTEEINTSVNYTVIIFDLIMKWLSYHLFNWHIGNDQHFVAWSSCPESSPSCHFQWQALREAII